MSKDFLTTIVDFAHGHLKNSTKALQYLVSRGVTEDQIYALKLGYIPPEVWPPFFSKDDGTDAEKFYLNKSKNGYKLKGKLLFPLTNPLGLYRGFQVRTPSEETKDYWKFYTLDSDIDALFFGLKSAMPYIWETREVVLVEGIFDLFPIRRTFPNSICTGTARMSDLQIKFLKRYVDRITFALDNDEYGDRAYNVFRQEHSSHFQSLNKLAYLGKDPSDSWDRLGEDRFQSQF